MSGGLGEWSVLGPLTLTAGGLHARTQADTNQDACAQYKKPISCSYFEIEP